MGEQAPGSRSDAPLGEPLLVDQAMLDALGPKVDGVALAVPSVAARRRGTEGMVFPAMAEPAARGLPGVAVHEEVAQAVAAALRGMG